MTPTLSDEKERAAYKDVARSILRLTNYRCPTSKSEINELAQQAGKLAAHYSSRPDERSRQSALPVESGKVEGDRVENVVNAICDTHEAQGEYVEHLMAVPPIPGDVAEAFARAALAADDQWRAAHPQPSSEEPSEQDIERATQRFQAIIGHVNDFLAGENDAGGALRCIELEAKAAILSYLKKD